MLRDLRYAARTLLNSPGFAAVAILSIALGTGAKTAIGIFCTPLILAKIAVCERIPSGCRRGGRPSKRGEIDACFT